MNNQYQPITQEEAAIASVEVLSIIYTHKYINLAASRQEGDFPEEPPKDKSELIKKINEMNVRLADLNVV